MSNQISTFNFKSNPVRVELFENQPHFCLADVCEVLDIKNSRRVNAEMLNEKGVRKTYTLTKGGKQELTFINEPNLYRIIFKSRKAEAIEFQNWVFEEVLPQIRKTGQYSVQQQLALPEPQKKYTFEFTEDELQDLTWAWFAFLRGAHTFQTIYEPLERLGSRYSAMVYGQAFEYRHTIREAHKIIERLTKEFDADPTTNWRVLRHVREFDPTFKKLVI